jgi:hypothetical protein
MKSIITLITSVLVLLTSCTQETNKVTKPDYSDYQDIVMDEVNKYNYNMVSADGEDTIQLVSIDTVVKVNNVPLFTQMVGEDTTTINIKNRVTAVVVACKVKVFKSGYYSVEDMTINYYEDEPESLFTSITSEYSDYNVDVALKSLKRTDKELLSQHRKTMLDIKRNKLL